MWPVSHFAELLQQLNTQFDVHFVLCGGTDDYAVCEDLAKKVSLKNLTNLAGQTSLLNLVEIIRAAALVISNDSSPVHIAAATGTPAICILGGGHFGRFLPYKTQRVALSRLPVPLWSEMHCFGCSWRCKFAPLRENVVPCIADVSIQEVTRASIKNIGIR
jgi:ADP-heptose:LPS heptosyltransferase